MFMPPFFAATMPDTDPSSPRGMSHLIVGAITALSVVTVGAIAISGHETPPVLDATALSGIGYLVGTAVNARGR